MRGRRDGLLDALCWCGATTVGVTPDAVRAGLTMSCGADGCGPGHPAIAPKAETVFEGRSQALEDWPGQAAESLAWLAQHTRRPRKTPEHTGRAQPTGHDVQRKLQAATRPPPDTHLGHRPEPTGRDRERTARRLAGPPPEAA